MPIALSPRRTAWLLGAVIVVCSAAALKLFPRSFPILAIDQRLTGALAEQKADSFARAHALPVNGERVATQFGGDYSLQTFLDLNGGADTVRAVTRGTDHALYTWRVRRFTPGDVHETRVTLSPDGRVLGFGRRLAESDVRPALSADSAQRLAEHVRDEWLDESPSRWRLATSSYETKPVSGRVDRTFTFERTERRLLGAPLRLTIVIGGDTPVSASRSVEVPEKWERRYTEMRASNSLLAGLSGLGQLLLFVAGAFALRRYSRRGGVRWRPALLTGGVIGVLMVGASLNELPSGWFSYDTATSPVVHVVTSLLGAVANGVITALLVGLTLAAAEAASRDAWPLQLDWWRWWSARGTRQVAGRVLGGYAMAAFALLYVSAFYLVTRKFFGWWTPTEMLDDPNQIATKFPWLAGLAMSLQAGIWEEAMFRVLPLALLATWAKDRPHRGRWMAAGIVGTALVFGFAHSTYTSWPAYSRGVELLLESSLWALIVVVFGPLTTMLGHFLFDFILFNLFAAMGSAPAYRVTAAIAVVVLLAPAVVVLWKAWKERGFGAATAEDIFATWRPEPEAPEGPPPAVLTLRPITPQARTWAVGLGIAALVVTFLAPERPTRGPRLTATRATVLQVADSALEARSVPVEGWTRLARVATDTMEAWPRFLKAQRAESLATTLATTYQPPAWWVVRYVHPHGGIERRAEEWRVRVWPDGRLLDVRHVLPDAAWRDSVSADEARAMARAALAAARFDTSRFVEAKLVSDTKAADSTKAQRKDVTVTYTDTTVHLPGEALARAWVSIAGNEVTVVRRGVELPEAWVRADRKRRTTMMAIGVGCGLAVFGLIAGGAVYVRSRRRPLIEDRPATKRRVIVVLTVLGVLQIAQTANGLPAIFATWDTAERWRSFIASTGLSVLTSLVLVAVVAGLWMAFDGLRRRVGIPFVQHGARAWSDTLVAGLGLAGAQAAIGGVLGAMAVERIPQAPTLGALIESAIPALSLALVVPLGTVMGVLGTALFAFVILLLAQSTARRVALLLAVGALGAAAMLAIGGRGTTAAHPVLLGVLAAAALPAFYLTYRTYAATSAMTWFVASILGMALSSSHGLLFQPIASLRVGSALSLVVCGVLLVLARRFVEREGGGAPAVS